MNKETQTLHSIWKKAVETYKAGNLSAETYFNDEEKKFLSSIGMNSQEMFDFAEDFVNREDPDFLTMALIQDVRKQYFKEEMEGKASDKQLDMNTLPPKTDSIDGIVWLPRILEKAKAKLRGEMPPELMYGCGGDRRFFKENNVHPAEFLKAVAYHWDDKQPIIDWVQERRKKHHTFLESLKDFFQ